MCSTPVDNGSCRYHVPPLILVLDEAQSLPWRVSVIAANFKYILFEYDPYRSTVYSIAKEVDAIGRRSAPIQIIVHYPQTETGRQELARRVASVHADAVNRKLQKLTCPTHQKRQLLDAVIQSAREDVKPQSL